MTHNSVSCTDSMKERRPEGLGNITMLLRHPNHTQFCEHQYCTDSMKERARLNGPGKARIVQVMSRGTQLGCYNGCMYCMSASYVYSNVLGTVTKPGSRERSASVSQYKA